MPTEEFTSDREPEIGETPPTYAPASRSGDQAETAEVVETVSVTTPYGTASGVRHASVVESASVAHALESASTADDAGAEPAAESPAESRVASAGTPDGPSAPADAQAGPTAASPWEPIPAEAMPPAIAPASPTAGSGSRAGSAVSAPSPGPSPRTPAQDTLPPSIPASVSASAATPADAGVAAVEPLPAPVAALAVQTSPVSSAVKSARPSERRRRLPVWTAAAALALLGVVGITGYAYAAHYEDVAVPGTKVAGIDVAGMDRDEIITTIENKVAGATVTISGDASATASLAELGTTVNAGATADAALARGDGLANRFTALVSDGEIAVVTSNDDVTTASYATSLIPSDKAAARNAGIALDDEETGFTVVPGAAGTAIDTTVLKKAAASAAASLSPVSVSVTYETRAPFVSDADAQTVADKANTWISQDVTISDGGDESYTADSATKASWITVTDNETSAPSIGVDGAKVSQWVTSQVDDVNEEPVNGKRNINSRGEVVATSVEAEDGREVTNAESVSTALTQAISSGQSYSGTFETKELKANWEERAIAPGAENLPYQAAVGEKWIDINLSNKTVTAYEGATVVHGPVSVVDGAGETPTVTGTYHVYLQYESQTMRGQNADGSDYETEGVPWITYFYQGYALHGAPWRSSFGFSGSHGCLNMPVDEAHWFYTWAEIGTTVTSHR